MDPSMDRGGDIQIRIESVDTCDVNVVPVENGLASSDSTSVDCGEETSDVFDELSPKRSEVCRRKSIIKDPARKSIGGNRKTVSFGSLPTELTVRSAKDCLKHMYSGGQLVKVRSASRVYRRFYWLDEEKCELKWEPSKKDTDKARVKLDDIHEVRSGKNSEVFLSVDTAEHFPEECAFSIVYGDDYNTLDLVAATTEEANIWCTGLRHLVSGKSAGENDMGTAKEAREKWLCEMFKSADINSDGFMDEDESVELIKTLSDGVRDNVIKTKLHEYLRNKKQEEGSDEENGSPVGLTQTEFVELFKDVATRPEVYFILVRYASHEDAMSIDDLRSFLEIEQGLGATREICKEIIEESEPSLQLREKEMLGIDGFTRYLSCDRCTLFNPEKRTPTQDMDKPFTQYFISASHNTYLIQDQLSGRTSLACFTTALEKGSRCLSMDLWSVVDNNNERILTVHHPRNNRLQVRLTAEAVFNTIKENAFEKTCYPLIVVIRVRADESAQHVLVRLLIDTFGELLCYGPDCPADPTPNNLKNRLLLEISGRSQEDYTLGSQPGLPIATPLIKRLSNLNFFTPEIVTGIPQGKEPLELSVMPETVASRVATSNAELLVQAGETQLIRVEPNDSRVDCSNYNPLDVWNMGVQMAALHFQTPGLMMDLNEGMFAANGGCGYALKPSIMIDSDISYDNTGKLQPQAINRNQHEVTTLHLRIISGTDLPKPRGAGSKGSVIDPYVLIEVFGAAADCAEHRTRTVHNCGRNPVFDESCEFRLTVPDMALIRFVILDDDFIGDEFIGQYTIAHSCLLPGYRVLKLHGIFGEELPGASLLVHIAISSSRETSRKKTMLRRRPSRVVSKLRSVGVKSADELYKSVNMAVRESGELRCTHETTTRELKEACGLQPVSNIKQVMRHLASRKMPIKFFIIEGLISIKVDISTLPEHSRKPYSAIESFVSHCRKLIQNGPILLRQIEQVHSEAIQLSETIQSLGSVDGLKSKKAAKVHENHAWNCRLLRGQSELLKNSIDLATTQLTQIIECGIQYSMIQGLLAEDWKESIACPTLRNDRLDDKRSIPASKYSPNKFSLRGLQRTLSADSSSTVRSFIPKTFKRVSKSESSKEL